MAARVENRFSGTLFYTRVAALGFLLISLTGLVSLIIDLITGNSGVLGFSLAILAIGLLVTGALLRFGAWAQVLAGLLSFLLLATVLPFSSYLLLHPEDGIDFIPVVILSVGAILGFVGVLVSLIQRRRHHFRTTATPAELLGLRLILAVLGLVALLSIVLTVVNRTTLSTEAKSNAVSIGIKDFQFSPNQIQVKAGTKVRLAVKNNDNTLHTFTLDDAGVNVSIPPGAERLIEFQAPKPGVYQWYCIPHSSAEPDGRTGMVGSLIVK